MITQYLLQLVCCLYAIVDDSDEMIPYNLSTHLPPLPSFFLTSTTTHHRITWFTIMYTVKSRNLRKSCWDNLQQDDRFQLTSATPYPIPPTNTAALTRTWTKLKAKSSWKECFFLKGYNLKQFSISQPKPKKIQKQNVEINTFNFYYSSTAYNDNMRITANFPCNDA